MPSKFTAFERPANLRLYTWLEDIEKASPAHLIKCADGNLSQGP